MAEVLPRFFFLLAIIALCVKCEEPEQCVKDDTNNHCVCLFRDNTKIDISQLFPDNDTPDSRFLETEKSGYQFFFHGCKDGKFKPFEYNITTANNMNITNTTQLGASLVLYRQWIEKGVPQSNLTVLGHESEIKYHVLPNVKAPFELIYKNKDGNITAAFRLICELYEKPYIQVIDDPQSMQFTLNTPYACVVKLPEGGSTGATILIIFLLACIVYFIGGGCLLYFVRGARGIEVIPNIDFWKRLPGLIRDGTLFVFGGCNPTYISSTEVYDRI